MDAAINVKTITKRRVGEEYAIYMNPIFASFVANVKICAYATMSIIALQFKITSGTCK